MAGRNSTATKKTVAKRTTTTPATDVVEGVVVEMSDDSAELLAVVGNREAAAAYAKKYIAEYVADTVTGERAGIKAARAAYGAVLGGWAIETGEKAADQITLDDIGAMLADGVAKRRQADGTYKPYSKAMVSGWRNAGEAYARGVDPESALGLALLARYSQFGPIKKAIQAPDATVEKIQKAVDEKKAAEKKTTSTSTSTTVTPAEPKTPLEKVQAALAGLSKDEMHAVLAEATAWVDSEAPAEETPAA